MTKLPANILVVDDSSLARRLTRQALEEMGHKVEEAADGAEALERYAINRHDLVLLDLVMQGMYGVEVLEKLRQVDPDARVVVATADIQKSTRDIVRSAGAFGLVNKPLSKDVLTSAVGRALEGEKLWI